MCALILTGHMWNYMCSTDMATDYLRRVRGDGGDSYSYDKHGVLQLEYGRLSIPRIPGLYIALENHVYRSGTENNAQVYYLQVVTGQVHV